MRGAVNLVKKLDNLANFLFCSLRKISLMMMALRIKVPTVASFCYKYQIVALATLSVVAQPWAVHREQGWYVENGL